MQRHMLKKMVGRFVVVSVLTAGAGMLLLGATNQSPFGAVQGDEEGGDIDLSAYIIEVSIKDGEFTDLNARGDVAMDFKGLRMMSDLLKYDPQQETLIAEVTKSPKVRIQGKDTNAQCGRVTYDMKREIYNLTGDCRINQPGMKLSGDQMSFWPAGEGKMQMVSDSLTSRKFNSAVDESGERSETARELENSVRDIQENLGVSETEAKILTTGKQRPTELQIDPSGSKKSDKKASNGPATGEITSETWDSVPGSGLQPED